MFLHVKHSTWVVKNEFALNTIGIRKYIFRYFPGLYPSLCGNKRKTVDEYVQGSGNINLIPAAISITVSFTSSILILGYPAEVCDLDIDLQSHLLGNDCKMFIK